MSERTLVLIKPDGVERAPGRRGHRPDRAQGPAAGRAGTAAWSSWSSRRSTTPSTQGKGFYDSLLEFITGGPLVALVVEGPRAIAAFRQLAGGTDPVEKAATGSIRGDFGLETQFNLVHGSDSPESAAREIGLWFPNL